MGELQYVKPSRPRQKRGPTARARAAKRRKEDVVETRVRAKCVERDGYCRLMGVGLCEGPSQWCHLGDKKRSKTRGQAPEVRHTTAGSFMGCEAHHAALDSRRISIEFLSDRGADGPIRCKGKTC